MQNFLQYLIVNSVWKTEVGRYGVEKFIQNTSLDNKKS